MEVISQRLEDFKSRIKALHLWKAYEIKVCLIRLEPTDIWKLGFIDIQLLNDADAVYELLYDHACLKLSREIRDMGSFNDFMTQIMMVQEEFVFKEEKGI
jgi:hypothetical protein